MTEPSILGILGTIITALLALTGLLVRLYIVAARRQVEEANARAQRYETMLYHALGATDRLIPLVERQARLVDTVEDVVGHGGPTRPDEAARQEETL